MRGIIHDWHVAPWSPPSNKIWSIRKTGNIKATKNYHSKAAAIKDACKRAKIEKAAVYVHGLNGQILSKKVF